jgi:hypothetical protein
METLYATFKSMMTKLAAVSGASACIACVGLVLLALAHAMGWTEKTLQSVKLDAAGQVVEGPVYALPVGGLIAEITWELQSCTAPLRIRARTSATPETRSGQYYKIINAKPLWAQWSSTQLSLTYSTTGAYLASLSFDSKDTTFATLAKVKAVADSVLQLFPSQPVAGSAQTSSSGNTPQTICSDEKRDALAALNALEIELGAVPDDTQKARLQLARKPLTISKRKWLADTGQFNFDLTPDEIRTLTGSREALAAAGLVEEVLRDEVMANRYVFEIADAGNGPSPQTLPGAIAQGIIYRMPATGDYRFCKGACPTSSATGSPKFEPFPAPQFGVIAILPISTGFLQSRFTLLCFDNNGALKAVHQNSASQLATDSGNDQSGKTLPTC